VTSRSWTKLVLLVVLAVVVGQLFGRGASRPGVSAGTAAPALSLASLGGGALDLARLRGKVVAVNFWATWCGPCRQELPDLAAFWTANRDRCFDLLGVVEESPRDAVDAAARRIPYPILLDEGSQAAMAWKVSGYPTTYLVDPEGMVRNVFVGPIGRAELEGAVAELRPSDCPSR
jgi:cytochrome c biogenesis protein CcmG/thiol:disulfide interchange protein DsbE